MEWNSNSQMVVLCLWTILVGVKMKLNILNIPASKTATVKRFMRGIYSKAASTTTPSPGTMRCYNGGLEMIYLRHVSHYINIGVLKSLAIFTTNLSLWEQLND